MVKKIGDKKIGGVKNDPSASKVEDASRVGGIKNVSQIGQVGKTGSVGSIGRRRATRAITLEEREQLLRLINEVGEELFGGPNGLSAEKRDIIESAARMAIDSGLMSKEDSLETPPKKTDGKK